MLPAHTANSASAGTWIPIMSHSVLAKMVKPVIPAVPMNR